MRTIRRYEIPRDGKPHTFQLTYADLVSTAESQSGGLLYFWAEDDSQEEPFEVLLQVVDTGDPLPEGALWLGTALRENDGEAWHLVMLPLEEPESGPEPSIGEQLPAFWTPPARALRERATREQAERVLTLAHGQGDGAA